MYDKSYVSAILFFAVSHGRYSRFRLQPDLQRSAHCLLIGEGKRVPPYPRYVAKKRYQAVGFPYNRMLKLSSSRGIRIDVPVLSVSWSVEDHSVIIQALRKGLIEHEGSDTGGVPR